MKMKTASTDCGSTAMTWLVTALVALLSPAVGRAHPGSHVGLKLQIEDQRVLINVLLSNDYSRILVPKQGDPPQFSTEHKEFRFDDPERGERIRRQFHKLFAEVNAVHIDNKLVPPIIENFRFVEPANPWGQGEMGIQPPDVEVDLVYPCQERPRQVSIMWELYPQDPALAAAGRETYTALLAELDAFTEREIVMFSPEEPEIFWHAPSKPAGERVQPVVATIEPRMISLPLVSAGIVLGWILMLGGLRVARMPRRLPRPMLYASVLPIVVAWLCVDMGAARFESPWGEQVRLPSAAEAEAIFKELHANVYSAFNYKTESDIYDVLAQSVAGDLLEQVYNEVYQGLIMRDQGGAVARVYSVDIQDSELVSVGQQETGEIAFRLRCRWQVYGVVSHWGHFHSRTNEYAAIYTVAQLGETWKITGAEVLEQRRLETDDDDPNEGDPNEESTEP